MRALPLDSFHETGGKIVTHSAFLGSLTLGPSKRIFVFENSQKPIQG